MKKILPFIFSIVLTAAIVSCMGSSHAMSNGGEVTGQRSASMMEPQPFGMIEVKRGFLKVGISNQDSHFEE